jgi:hypothetical protein
MLTKISHLTFVPIPWAIPGVNLITKTKALTPYVVKVASNSASNAITSPKLRLYYFIYYFLLHFPGHNGTCIKEVGIFHKQIAGREGDRSQVTGCIPVDNRAASRTARIFTFAIAGGAHERWGTSCWPVWK